MQTTLINVPRSEKAASLRKRRKDELDKYRKAQVEVGIDTVFKDGDFSLPDEDKFLTEMFNVFCQQPDPVEGVGRCLGYIGLERRILSQDNHPNQHYGISCKKCGFEYVKFQPTSQAAMAAWRVYRAMCK